jgi:hypothetical protein
MQWASFLNLIYINNFLPKYQTVKEWSRKTFYLCQEWGYICDYCAILALNASGKCQAILEQQMKNKMKFQFGHNSSKIDHIRQTTTASKKSLLVISLHSFSFTKSAQAYPSAAFSEWTETFILNKGYG